MKKFLAMSAAAVMTVSILSSCSNKTPTLLNFIPQKEIAVSAIDNPLYNDTVKLLQFNYGDITLFDGMYKDVYDGCMEYYDSVTVDDILYTWRKSVGLDTKTGRDLDWSQQCCLGQLISSKARKYATTNDPKDLDTVQYLVDSYLELAEIAGVQVGIWGPYNYEKRVRAFMDIYNYCHIEEAYDIAKAIIEYGIATPQFNNPRKWLGDNSTEWYIMGEALNLFVELAEKKGESAEDISRYRAFADIYEYTEFWDIFLYEENLFDYKVKSDYDFENRSAFHAFSHVNTFNSALEIYKQTDEDKYLNLSIYFHNWLNESQRLATGGYGVNLEHLLERDKLINLLSDVKNSYETQCGAYAIVTVDNRLLSYTGNANYGNWTEDAFYNMTLGSLETKDGAAHYYSHVAKNGGTKFRIEGWLWACCAGTRPLVVQEYLRSIYFNDTKNLYVNLYTNSSVNFENKNGNKITLTQQSQYPIEDTVNFTINSSIEEEFAISFRKPEWLSLEATISVNGTSVTYIEKDGWYMVERVWKDGDTVELKLPMELHYSVLEGEHIKYGLYALKYGPVTLAYNGYTNNLAELVPINSDPNDLFEKTEETLNFSSKKDNSVIFKPYYVYEENEIYTMYIKYREKD